MQPIEPALRLLDTQQAHLGVWLAVVPVVAAAVIVALRRPQQLFRGRLPVIPRLFLILAVGVVAAGGMIHVTYDGWYRHRCVHHHSDIPECFSEGRRSSH